jgi:hypothetical protein
MVKDYFTEKQKGIRKSMKIQNYAQFFPNIIINIDNWCCIVPGFKKVSIDWYIII